MHQRRYGEGTRTIFCRQKKFTCHRMYKCRVSPLNHVVEDLYIFATEPWSPPLCCVLKNRGRPQIKTLFHTEVKSCFEFSGWRCYHSTVIGATTACEVRGHVMMSVTRNIHYVLHLSPYYTVKVMTTWYIGDGPDYLHRLQLRHANNGTIHSCLHPGVSKHNKK